MNNIELIETTCAGLAKARADLRRKHEAKQKEQIVLDSRHNPGLRVAQQTCHELRTTLLNLLESSREDFKKPKLRDFHGITVGFKKKQDALLYPEEKVLVDRIEKMLPAKQAETVLDRSVTIIKAAFKKLPWEILQRLGCSKVSGADSATVLTSDDDIETLVTKSLGEAAPAAPEVQS